MEALDELARLRREEEKWENSIEGIVYNLQIPDGLSGEEFDAKKCKLYIAKTLLKLPKKIREKVLDEVMFIIVGGWQGHGTRLLFNEAVNEKDTKRIGDRIYIQVKKPVIFLDFSKMKRESKSRKMDTIAHEIAHFILGHGGVTNDEEAERKADDLSEKWGFKRVYKSYKKFENGYKFNHF